MIRPYLTFIYVLIGIALAATLWFSGEHHGKVTATSACNVERIATLTATNRELVRLKDIAERYAAQVNQANVDRDQANLELARLSRIPHPRLLCHSAASSSSDPVPSTASQARPGAAVLGELPVQPDFDPVPALYAEARRADALVEGCRDALNRWPQ